MGRLKNIFKLSSKITLYIPSTKEVNREIDNAEHVEQAAKLLSWLFGGSTSTPGLGYWISNKGLVREKVDLVFAYASEKDLKEKIDQVVDYAERLKKELSQESIALEINGEMYFI